MCIGVLELQAMNIKIGLQLSLVDNTFAMADSAEIVRHAGKITVLRAAQISPLACQENTARSTRVVTIFQTN
jgi:hypothetical protein